MQAQQRAENGIEEIVIGYFSDPDGPALGDEQELDFSEFVDFGLQEMALDHLPVEMQAVYRAEMHRIKTGEVRPASEFETSLTKPK